MTAGPCRPFSTAVAVLLLFMCSDASCQRTTFQVCGVCEGTLRSGTAVGNFCVKLSGQVVGRCCIGSLGQNTDFIAGLDLSNCSLVELKPLIEASSAEIIDLSANPSLNLTDADFEGFTELQHLRLPSHLTCPGGNASWEKVQMRGELCLCDGQRNSCNQTGQMSQDCPSNSLCAPNGPGRFQCSCAHGYHGYKCLREGQFPLAEVLGILGGATVLVSAALWVTQRRKAKTI
ncbi:hypothetical protein GJAV_G00107390 [Gymnothorax javanicus]|nr:hypothetical protein GJAV_G00107390 [Gymnothorax javanicus]